MPDRTVRAVPRFLKSKRGFPEAVQKEIDARVRGLIEDPLQGVPKAGALKGVRVIKLKVSVQQYLLAYRFFAKPNAIELLDVGPHENFYRDLQEYLDSR